MSVGQIGVSPVHFWWLSEKSADLLSVGQIGVSSVQSWCLTAPLTCCLSDRSVPAPCSRRSPWQRAAPAESLSGAELWSRASGELTEGGLSTHCGRLRQLEGRPLCLDADLLPERGPCLVYSAGAAGAAAPGLALELELARRHRCQVHLLDSAGPTAARLPANVSHHSVQVAAAAGHRRAADGSRLALMTLDQATELLGHSGQPIHYLRLAGAGSWEVLEQQLAAAGSALGRVQQLSVPLQLPEETAPDGEQRARRLLRILTALRTDGLRLAHAHTASGPASSEPVYETLWVRWEERPC